MSVNYKTVVDYIDKESVRQPADGEFSYYGYDGLLPVPSMTETVKNEVVFPFVTGCVVGLGHYLG